MNASQIVTHMTDEDWVVEIHAAEDGFDFLTPYALGELDAQDNEPCVPEMYFAQRTQMEEYARGYEAVAGWTLLSAAILRPDEATHYAMGAADYNHDRYFPPHFDSPNYSPYLRGWNDAWAAANNRKLAR